MTAGPERKALSDRDARLRAVHEKVALSNALAEEAEAELHRAKERAVTQARRNGGGSGD